MNGIEKMPEINNPEMNNLSERVDDFLENLRSKKVDPTIIEDEFAVIHSLAINDKYLERIFREKGISLEEVRELIKEEYKKRAVEEINSEEGIGNSIPNQKNKFLNRCLNRAGLRLEDIKIPKGKLGKLGNIGK